MINSISDINMNLEEGRLLYSAMSLLRDMVAQQLPEADEEKVSPQIIFEGVKKRQFELFPDIKPVSSILSETGEPIKL